VFDAQGKFLKNIAVPGRGGSHVAPDGTLFISDVNAGAVTLIKNDQIVEVIKVDERTDAGLYLPAGAKEAQDEAFYGRVVEVARDKATSDDVMENVSGVPLNAFVLFRKDAGVRVPWDDRLRLIDVKDILATVEEVTVDEAH